MQYSTTGGGLLLSQVAEPVADRCGHRPPARPLERLRRFPGIRHGDKKARSPGRADASKTSPFSNAVHSPLSRNAIEQSRQEPDEHRTNNYIVQPCILSEQKDIVSLPMNLLRKQQPSVLWCFPVLLLLSGCGETGPECGSLDARNSVLKTVADDHNNRLVNFAVENSGSVEEMLNHAKAEADKSAIRENAKQGAIYSLDDTIVVNSRNRAAATCTGLLSVSVGDTTVEKEVEFGVEQAADGKTSVAVKPFLF
jgi:hypothetical protein